MGANFWAEGITFPACFLFVYNAIKHKIIHCFNVIGMDRVEDGNIKPHKNPKYTAFKSFSARELKAKIAAILI